MDDQLTWADATAQAELVAERIALARSSSSRRRSSGSTGATRRSTPSSTAASTPRARRPAGALPDGPFRGVPILLKDLGAPQAGEPYCEGTAFAKAAGYRADQDSYLVQRFQKAGFVVLGRTNTPELGTPITTEPLAFGPTRNPWNTERSSGGSSGGSAAAVAVGHGPGRARQRRRRLDPDPGELLRAVRAEAEPGPREQGAGGGRGLGRAFRRPRPHPVGARLGGRARRDRRLPPGRHLRRTAARPAVRRQRSAPIPAGCGSASSSSRPRRASGSDPECAAAVRSTGRLLESLGHRVEIAHPASLDEPEYQRHFLALVATAVAAALAHWSALLGRRFPPEEFEPMNTMFATLGRSISAPDYLESMLWLEGYRRRTIAFWSEQGFDLLCTPVLALPPGPPRRAVRPGAGGLNRVLETLQFTSQFNVSGQPAASLPLHWAPTAFRSGSSSSRTTGARTCFSESRASSSRRARGSAGTRRSTPDRRDGPAVPRGRKCRASRNDG